MNTRLITPARLLLAATLSTAAIAAVTLTAPARAQAQAPSGAAAAATAPAPLPLAQVLARLEAAGYTDVQEIERKRRHVEVKATDAQGRRVELRLDPATAQVLDTELKSAPRRGADAGAPRS